MIEISRAIFFHPANQEEKFHGRVFQEEGKTYCEILNYGTLAKLNTKFYIDILWVIDEMTNKKFSFVSLPVKSWNATGKATFLITELYEGTWIPDVHEKVYTRCVIQMSGLAAWFGLPLIDTSFENENVIIKAKEDAEKEFITSNNLSIIFRKFHQFKRDELSVQIQENASLILTCNDEMSRLYFNNLAKSFRYLLSIALPAIPRIWQIDHSSPGKNIVSLKIEKIGSHEIQQSNGILFNLTDISQLVISNWLEKQNQLNEICSLIIEARENIVIETSFTYCTKVFELIYKNLLLPESDQIFSVVIEKMKKANIWENNWKEDKINVNSSKRNFRIVLCTLWEIFSSKEGFQNTFNDPYAFLLKVQHSRNHYTHLEYRNDFFGQSQLITVNKILVAFAYGLILQYLGFENEKINKFTKAYSGFSFAPEYDSNPYSINYKEENKL